MKGARRQVGMSQWIHTDVTLPLGHQGILWKFREIRCILKKCSHTDFCLQFQDVCGPSETYPEMTSLWCLNGKPHYSQLVSVWGYPMQDSSIGNICTGASRHADQEVLNAVSTHPPVAPPYFSPGQTRRGVWRLSLTLPQRLLHEEFRPALLTLLGVCFLEGSTNTTGTRNNQKEEVIRGGLGSRSLVTQLARKVPSQMVLEV